MRHNLFGDRKPETPTNNEQAPLTVKHAVGSTSGGGAASRYCSRNNGLGMTAMEEPWFDEAKATVLFDVDDLR